jgi:hypothetical protein
VIECARRRQAECVCVCAQCFDIVLPRIPVPVHRLWLEVRACCCRVRRCDVSCVVQRLDEIDKEIEARMKSSRVCTTRDSVSRVRARVCA